jgi:hypothetical protein
MGEQVQPIKLGIITPTKYLNQFAVSDYHLVLAHIVESNDEYRDFYKKRSEEGDFITLDNSSYEIGDDHYTPSDLIELAEEVGASEVMAPEHYLDADKTIEKAGAFLEEFRAKVGPNLGVICTAHGKDLDDIIRCHDELIKLGTDTIGLSCRLDCELPSYSRVSELIEEETNISMIRSLKRVGIVVEIMTRRHVSKKLKAYHLLGLNHPRELQMYYHIKRAGLNIRSNDSSAAFLAGLNEIVFSRQYLKLPVSLDFDLDIEMSNDQVETIDTNIDILTEYARFES